LGLLLKGFEREGMGTIEGIVIAGTHSGVGKTTIALGLMAALRRRGLRVAPFKVGPDFIDPGHHALAAACASRNLDGWMLSREYNQAAFRRHGAGADLAVVEGVMGLFDGAGNDSEEGSTAQMAKWLGLPVLLVVDAASMARVPGPWSRGSRVSIQPCALSACASTTWAAPAIWTI